MGRDPVEFEKRWPKPLCLSALMKHMQLSVGPFSSFPDATQVRSEINSITMKDNVNELVRKRDNIKLK